MNHFKNLTQTTNEFEEDLPEDMCISDASGSDGGESDSVDGSEGTSEDGLSNSESDSEDNIEGDQDSSGDDLESDQDSSEDDIKGDQNGSEDNSRNDFEDKSGSDYNDDTEDDSETYDEGSEDDSNDDSEGDNSSTTSSSSFSCSSWLPHFQPPPTQQFQSSQQCSGVLPLSSIETFRKLFSDDIINLIHKQTNIYGKQKYQNARGETSWIDITKREIDSH
ncbi:unnamed protein product [Rotaria sordida]|uniref:Uncharacterized protein n=1 Tax=Rotaria sordida TaxID=392033 RepID=A0A815VWI6_9BILA|nr:unnamed protein product [Rotaria sordida]